MTSPAAAVRDIYVDANGLRHHLLARGEPGAPAVMFLHGLAGQAHNFDVAAARLSESFHVYALDMRGRGESEWGPAAGYSFPHYIDDLEAVRGALGIQQFALVGTWMGGLLSIAYAARYPERVSRLVVNDIGPEPEEAGRKRLDAYLNDSPREFPDMKAVVRYYQEHYGPFLAGMSEQDLAEFVRWHVRRSDMGVYTWKFDPELRDREPPPPPEELWKAFEQVKCPVLVLRALESDLLSEATAQRMREVHPDCTVVEVPRAGHAPAITDETTIETIDTFLRAGGAAGTTTDDQ